MKTGIMVAPNGARLKYDEHNNIPLNTQEIVKTAKACEEAGANAIHLHVRDDKYNHILDVKKYKDTIKEIKKNCSKEFIIQATTEAVGIYKPNEMINLVKELKPQATSVAIKEIVQNNDNVEELRNAKKFYKFTKNENIGVQHILYSNDDLKRFHKLLEQEVICGDKHSLLFVLGRYSKDLNCKTTNIIPFLHTLKKLELESNVHWMLCAFGQMETPSLINASILGGHCRIGFENSRLKSDGTKAKNNQSQVKNLRTYLDSIDIQKVSFSQMKQILGIFK
jgi:uncharacterized protein (DUF849 family)